MMCNNQFGHLAGRKLTGARQGNEEIVNFVALILITGRFGDRLSPNISKGRRKNNAFSLGKLTHIDCRWIPTLLSSLLCRKSSLVRHSGLSICHQDTFAEQLQYARLRIDTSAKFCDKTRFN
ncbi:hypothetical protein [Fluviibacter phosphoraccumulans]|uniref:hypothetical protein n=1 Tax=Fluviibacter phosphoraccumulans TaxID=1751046 RepID=UPI0010AF9B43|nr:hypothetical protein [Fluviibacter phosphoraccumulans]